MKPQLKTIHSEEYKILIDCLKQFRKSANLTQLELAERIGTDQTYISKYERGERRLDIIEVMAICKGMNIKFIKFFQVFESQLKMKKNYE